MRNYKDEVFPGEEALLKKSYPLRQRQFEAGRRSARQALAHLGYAPCEILKGALGEPLWPPGLVGSLSHKKNLAVAVVGRKSAVASLGIDIELDRPIPRAPRALIFRRNDREALSDFEYHWPDKNWDTVLFSCKESALKAFTSEFQKIINIFDISIEKSQASNIVVLSIKNFPSMKYFGVWQFMGEYVATLAWRA